MIDLRSDTVTKPTPAMRRAMMEAEVGDDVYGEDPTVNRLEQRAAEIAGKEAALFVPTGTMGNTIAVKLHTEHGQEVICDSRAHVLDYELAMMAWFSGCLARAQPTFAQARLYRKRLGGGMRQAGILAAAGLIALEEMPARLGEDHANAQFLARGLAGIPGIAVDPAMVQTNIIIFDVTVTGLAGPEFSARLKAGGVLLNSINDREMRALTHCDVTRADCEQALQVAQAVAASTR
jgi:threonine aldolase